MPKLWLLLLAVYAASFAAGVPTEDECFKAAAKQAEEAAAARREDKNKQQRQLEKMNADATLSLQSRTTTTTHTKEANKGCKHNPRPI